MSISTYILFVPTGFTATINKSESHIDTTVNAQSFLPTTAPLLCRPMSRIPVFIELVCWHSTNVHTAYLEITSSPTPLTGLPATP